MCLKCKSINNNHLFIELLLYKINVTFAIVLVLGHVMLLTICYIKYFLYVCFCVCAVAPISFDFPVSQMGCTSLN